METQTTVESSEPSATVSSLPSVPNVPDDFDPLDSEAPISHLLSVRHNPRVKDMTTQQLTDLITKLRTVATSPQTMTATISRDAKRRPMTEAQRKRKELLDSI